MTHEQAEMLDAIRARHGQLRRVPDASSLADQVLSQCVSDTYVYQCRHCLALFAVEPDGECGIWLPERLVD